MANLLIVVGYSAGQPFENPLCEHTRSVLELGHISSIRFINSFTHLLINSFLHVFIYSLISFIHSLNHGYPTTANKHVRVWLKQPCVVSAPSAFLDRKPQTASHKPRRGNALRTLKQSCTTDVPCPRLSTTALAASHKPPTSMQ